VKSKKTKKAEKYKAEMRTRENTKTRTLGMILFCNWLVLTLVCPLAVLHAQESKVIDRVVAVVDNEIVLDSELFQYLQYQMGSQAQLDALSPAEIDTLKSQILGQLIDQKVLLAKGRLDTVVVDAKDVDRELDSRIKALVDQAGGQDRLEDYYGMPMARIKKQFRALVEESLLIDKVKQQKVATVQVTPGEVSRFWESFKDSIPDLRDGIRLAHILLSDELSEASAAAATAQADSVRTLILAGKADFEQYAKDHSDDPGSAANGGKLGQTNRGDLVPQYEEAAYNLKPGEISAPVLSPFGVHIIRLNERVGEKVNTNHILFRLVPAEADRQITEARADSLINAVKGGADFAGLALSYSRDQKTMNKGGDLGWFAPDELPPEFADAVKDLKKGELAKPTRTAFGVHVLSVTDRVYKRKITLADDFDRIERMALAKKQDEVMTKWVKELAGKTYIEVKS
jgi:peptidyl-prolyl cis-trans isomerase SurA